MNDKNLISFFLLTLFYELWITQTILSIEGWLHLNLQKKYLSDFFFKLVDFCSTSCNLLGIILNMQSIDIKFHD